MLDFTRRSFLAEQEKGCRKYGVFSSAFDAFRQKRDLALRVRLETLNCRNPALQRPIAFAALAFFHLTFSNRMKFNHLNEFGP